MKPARRINGSTIPSFWDIEENCLKIDLSVTEFIEPIGLVMITAAAEAATRAGKLVIFVEPASDSVKNYLSRMGFAGQLSRLGIEHQLPTVKSNPLPDHLVELQQVSGEHAGEELARIVHTRLMEGSTDPQAAEAIHSAICEAIGNIEFHAEVESGLVAAQTLNHGRSVLIAVADSGIGLRKSLENRMSVNDDMNAIELATVANVTATGEKGRGQGLPDVLHTATSLGGTVIISSGNAYFEQTRGTIRKTTLDAPFQGTVIQVQLECVPQG